ncbi:bile acid:sodium symporter [Cellulomonas bogoriensis]|uniref:Bile acid:sodium symporter n=1 Tax=Cellulomonas bogoriensis 69B4 = DSM 16987 TaxID=1386082 RepID=A0A0A0BXA5_9CELL|nr:bile acid:sodium symporter [Cellulomonas bogoriensis]KGM13043.1 bile acid:sodium symporter [Cellulomonas bogoriensis 69B4 = DSM 16987]
MTRQALEKHQVWVYVAAIGLGLGVGTVAPAVGPVAERVLWPALALLLYVTFVQVPLLHLRAALVDARFTGAALTGNFVIMPLVVWGLVQVLPADPAVRVGVLLVLLVPCTDWFITFTQLSGGDTARAIAVSPVNLLLQLVLLPVYLLVMAPAEVSAVVDGDVVWPALVVVLGPLAAAALTERWVGDAPARARWRDRSGWAPVPLLALVVLLVAAAQAGTVLDAVGLLPVLVPVFVGFALTAVVVARGLASAFSLPDRQARTLTFGLVTRNSFVVLPLALALPGDLQVAAVVVVVQSVVELLLVVLLLPWVGRTRRRRAP